MDQKSIIELTKIALDSFKVNISVETGMLTNPETVQNYSLFMSNIVCNVYDSIKQHYNSEV